MVLMNFDEETLLAKRTASNPWDANSETPVRLNVAGVELLGWEGWSGQGRASDKAEGLLLDGISQSVIDVARWGLTCLLRLGQEGRAVFYLGENGEYGELLFKKSGQEILIYSRPYEKVVSVPYDKLLVAWNQFADEVRAFLLREYPGIRNPDWNRTNKAYQHGWKEWLEDGVLGPISYVDGWSPYFDEYEERFSHVDAKEL